MPILQESARAAIKKHGGLRAAARATGISPSTLLFLADGRRRNASIKTMQRLGVELIRVRGA